MWTPNRRTVLTLSSCAFAQKENYHGAYDPSTAPVFNTKPNAFLAACIQGRKPGVALDVGMGAGRNSIYLAEQGWRVVGFDIARAGVEQARRESLQRGLRIEARVADENEFDFGEARWNLVVLTYQPFRHLLPKITRGLADGGLIVVENFHRDTKRYRLLNEGIDSNELPRLFDGFRILRYEDVDAAPDWGIEFPVNRLVRILVRKGGAQSSGCDWKGKSKSEGDTAEWGRVKLKCGPHGWERVK